MNTHKLHLSADVIESLGEEFLNDDAPLEAVSMEDDRDVALFVSTIRGGGTPSLALCARLMAAGFDVEALENSVTS